MSKCYLCDLCGRWYPTANDDAHFVYCDQKHEGVFMLEQKRAIDYGRDDPMEICKHFKAKEDE